MDSHIQCQNFGEEQSTRRRLLPVVATRCQVHTTRHTHKVGDVKVSDCIFHNVSWKSCMAEWWLKPCRCAKVGLPTILCTVGIRSSVGAWSTFQPSDVEIVKSQTILPSGSLSFSFSCWISLAPRSLQPHDNSPSPWKGLLYLPCWALGVGSVWVVASYAICCYNCTHLLLGGSSPLVSG